MDFSSDQIQEEQYENFSDKKEIESAQQDTQRRNTTRSVVSVDDQISKQLTTYTLSMLNFIPATILLQLSSENGGQLSLPLNYKYKSVVLVAELQYFYDQFNNANGDCIDEQNLNEQLQGVCHSFLEIFTSVLNKYNGDLIQFLGTSLIAVWPSGDDLDSCKKSAACALEILKEAQKFLQQSDGKKLEPNQRQPVQLLFGLGYGDFQILHMGGIFNRIEFFVAGQALINAMSALRATEASNPIAVSGEMWPMLEDFVIGEKIESKKRRSISMSPIVGRDAREDRHDFQVPLYSITKTLQNIRLTRDTNLQKVKTSEETIKKIQAYLKSYIPGSYRHLSQLKQDETRYGIHLKVTIVAIAIELQSNLLDQKNQESVNAEVVQSIIQLVQAQIYKMEGAVTKVISYENGLIFIATWGMQFLSHLDDCTRAVYAAQNIKQHLIKFQGEMEVDDDSFAEPPVHIGIASGDVFQGVVGNFARREIVGIGDVSERAIHLLQKSLQQNNKIFVDSNTKHIASHSIDFKFIEYHEIPNKYINLAIFEPVFETYPISSEASEFKIMLRDRNRAREQAFKIRLHSNPLFDDRDSSYLKSFSEAYGRSDTLNSIISDIEDYVQSDDTLMVWVLAIRGAVGSGKSLFARRLILEVSEMEKNIFSPLQDEFPSLHFEFFVCASSVNNRLSFLGIWRPFIQHLLSLFSAQTRQAKDYIIINQMQKAGIEDKARIVEEIFNLRNLGKKSKHNTTINTHTQIGAQKFDQKTEEAMIQFCFDFITYALEFLREEIFMFLVLDNAELMDCSSWRLFNMIQQECCSMIMVIGIECTQNYFQVDIQHSVSQLNFKIDSDEATQNFYLEYIKPREQEIFSVADMTPVNRQTLKLALMDLGSVYERTMTKEIEDMTKIIDSSNPLKTFAGQKDVALRLSMQYQIFQLYTMINDEVLEEIWQKSEGNPLIAFQFAFQAIIQGFISVEESILQSSPKFKLAVMLNSWTGLRLPYIILKKMCVLLENSLKTKVQGGIGKYDMNSVMQQIQVLQTASVVGDYFSLQLVDYANKVLVEKKNQYMTAQLLKELEDRDLIELILQDQETGDIVYRFTYPFLRNAMYQMQTFATQKKHTHQNIINYMQSKVIYDYTTNWSFEKENLILLRHIMSVERVQSEDLLSSKGRQGLAIKKINQQMSKLSSKLKQGPVRLSMDGGKTDQLLFAMLTPRKLEFYLQTGPEELPEYELVCLVDMKQIIKIKPPKDYDKGQVFDNNLQQQTTEGVQDTQKLVDLGFSFQIKVNKWDRIEKVKYETSMKTQAPAVLIVGQAQDNKRSKRDTEDWMTAIEYVRTKLTYDNFVNSFGQISFQVPENVKVSPLSHLLEKTREKFSTKFLLKDSQQKSRNFLRSLSLTKSETKQTPTPPVSSLGKQKLSKGKESKVELFHLMRRIKAMYNISCISFLDQLKNKPENQEMGEVSSELRQGFLELCYDVDAVMPSETTSQDQLTDSESSSDSQKILPHNMVSDFSNQAQEVLPEPVLSEVALTVEERKVRRLTRIFSEWREGALVTESVKSQTDQAVQNASFKLKRRNDAFGYNQILSPYKEVDQAVSQILRDNETTPQSITRINSEARLPQNTRKPKALGIEKVLENSNSPWFLQYLRHQQSILLEEQRKLKPPTPKAQQSPAVNSSVQKIQNQPSQTDIVLEVRTPGPKAEQITAQKHHAKGKSSSITSRRGILLAESLQSKRGDFGQIYDSAERPISDASFKDYYSGNLYAQRQQQPAIVLNQAGSPVILSADNPQYIISCGPKLKLKSGDVLYLSVDLIDRMQVIKCLSWNEKVRVDVVVARNEISIPSERVPNLRNYRQASERITQNPGISSTDYLLEKNEESKESLSKNIQYFSQAFGGQPTEESQTQGYQRRSSSKQNMQSQSTIVMQKLQKRQEIRLRQKMLQQNLPLSELLSSPQKQVFSPQVQHISIATTTENYNSPKGTSRRHTQIEGSPHTSAAYMTAMTEQNTNQKSAVPALKMQERLRRKLQQQLNI